MPIDATELAELISAVAALGTAASGLVDTTKLFAGGVSQVGFATIKQQLTPFNPLLNMMPEGSALKTIYGLWINGAAIEDQKAKAKALIKLGFRTTTVDAMAAATGLPAASLKPLAENIENGTDLSAPQVNIYGQLDAILSAAVDAAYETADQRYRNAAKGLSAAIAIVLAETGEFALNGLGFSHFFMALVVGAIATPLAPVAKDLTSAINTAVQASSKLQGLLK